jgi:hypothetical protein
MLMRRMSKSCSRLVEVVRGRRDVVVEVGFVVGGLTS